MKSNSGKPSCLLSDGNPEPSLVKARKVQRLDGFDLRSSEYGSGIVQTTKPEYQVAVKTVVVC